MCNFAHRESITDKTPITKTIESTIHNKAKKNNNSIRTIWGEMRKYNYKIKPLMKIKTSIARVTMMLCLAMLTTMGVYIYNGRVRVKK